jgi:GT2 family glycosyltransferase
MVGGVLAITPEHFQAANGFSNRFFGWGGEDDDFYARLRSANLTLGRLAGALGRYVALKHRKQPPADNLHQRLQQARHLPALATVFY